MSTAALVLMITAWSYILITAIYLFVKVIRKQKERRDPAGYRDDA
jgi:hypothetical protein